VPAVLALWTLGTFAYQCFRYFPYLIFTSPTRRCGKSRALQTIGALAFNSSGLQAHPSEAVLYRSVEISGGCFLLDEMEKLKESNKDLYGGLLAILNVGFQAGSTVPRMEVDAPGKFRMRDFPVYVPRAFATIETLARTLQDRSLVIAMPRRKQEEPIERWRPRRVEPEAEALRDRAVIWALTHAPRLRELYEGLDEIEALQGLDDRALDLFEPLWAIATLAAEEGEPTWQQAVETFARLQAGHRGDAEREETLPALIECLWELRQEGIGEATAEVLLQRVQRESALHWMDTEDKVGRWLRRLGLKKVRRREGTQRLRSYVLDPERLEDLHQRYCAMATQDDGVPF
jgi:hypothetical protein